MRVLVPILLLVSLGSVAQQGKADERSAKLAADCVQAMGGEDAYAQTHYLTWRFFGKRLHVWDKYTGDVRVENGKGLVVAMNINTHKGKVWQDGVEITEPKELEEQLQWGYEVWINDSYWLVMPYKLRDPGVNLVFTREDQTADGRAASVLTMTFDGVGVTPENKYEIFFDNETHLVTQWSFFAKAEDSTPGFTNPWLEWQKHGKILLSASRGDHVHTNVGVLETVPPTTFNSPEALPELAP